MHLLIAVQAPDLSSVRDGNWHQEISGNISFTGYTAVST
jgi:hypothetical protein